MINANNTDVSAAYFHHPGAYYTVLYSHGNATDLERLMPYLQALSQHGYNVLGYDYQGYGHSNGKASESNTYKDALIAYHYLRDRQHLKAQQIILMGHSLGTGVAVHLASEVPIAAMILESPMLSIYHIITGIALFYPDFYNSAALIKSIHTPLLIIHGTNDSTIPYRNGYRLYQLANPPKTFIGVKGAGHNNIAEVIGPIYWQVLRGFIDEINQFKPNDEKFSVI